MKLVSTLNIVYMQIFVLAKNKIKAEAIEENDMFEYIKRKTKKMFKKQDEIHVSGTFFLRKSIRILCEVQR